MSAELLNLLRHGGPQQVQQQQEQQGEHKQVGNPALELLARDLDMPPQAAGANPNTTSQAQTASLLSLLQGQAQQVPLPQEEREPEVPKQHQDQDQGQEQVAASLPPPLPAGASHESPKGEAPMQASNSLDALWSMLSPKSQQLSQDLPPSADRSRQHTPEQVSEPPAAPSHTDHVPSSSNGPSSPFHFFSGFDVLAHRQQPATDYGNNNNLNQTSSKARISPGGSPSQKPQKPVMRVSSPLRPSSPVSGGSPNTVRSREASRAPPLQQQNQQKRSAGSTNLRDSPDSASAHGGSPKHNVSILQRPPPQSSVGGGSEHSEPTSKSAPEVSDLWLASNLLDEAAETAPANSSGPGVAVSSPRHEVQEQAIRIAIPQPNLDLLYRGERSITPITLFATPHTFAVGRKLDLFKSIIIYATRMGRLRVLDRTSGARLLLKGHTGPVSDLSLNPMPGAPETEILVISASVSAPKIMLWKVAADVVGAGDGAYPNLPSGYAILLELSLKNDANVRCIRRLREDLFAFATTDSRLLLLDVASEGWSKFIAQGNNTAHEADLMSSGALKQVKFGDPVVDLAVAPDASAVVVLDAAGNLHIGDVTSERSLKPRRKTPFASKDMVAEQISLVPFDASGSSKGYFVAISYEQGRVLHVCNLLGNVLSSVTLEQPSDADMPPSFGRLSYNPAYSSLMLSSSLRGSLYALRVAPTPPAEPSLLSLGDRDLDCLIHASTSPRNSSPSARIDRLLELPCHKHALEYVDASADLDDPSLFCVALDGISQVHVDSSVLQEFAAAPATPVVAEHDRNTTHSNTPDSSSAEPHTGNFKDAIGVELDTAIATDRESHAGSPSLKPRVTSDEQSPPFISSLKSRALSASTKKSPSANVATSAAQALPEYSNMSEQLHELEERLFSRVERLVTEREAAAERRAREERSAEQAAEITRQEKLLAMVSQTLGKQTNKTLDSSIRSEIRDSLLPAISKTVRESVDAELAAVLRSSLQKTIPDSMNNFFNRPDVTNHLVRSFSSSAGPMIERSVSQAISQHFNHHHQRLTDSLSKEVRVEMLNVRKELEAEQSAALADLSDNVVQIKEMMHHQSESRAASSQPFAPQFSPVGQAHRGYQQQQQQPQQQSASQHQARHVRSPTPVNSYEDKLLDALSVEDESHLAPFIEDAPQHRINAIFSSGPKPVISQPVILSLMHRLVRSLPSRQGPFGSGDHIRLQWFKACLDSLDFNDPSTSTYIPRILEVTSNTLSQAQGRLMSAGDMQGMGSLNSILSQLSFHQGNTRR